MPDSTSPLPFTADEIVDTVREPMLVLSADLRVLRANRSFYDNFDVTPETTIGRLVYKLGNRQWDIPALRALLEGILPSQSTFDGYEVAHDFEGIGRRVMLLNARQVRGHDDAGLILLAMEDITERRRLEDERRELETRFTSLVKNIRDHSIFTLDQQGRITSWNREAERILGHNESDALGQHFSIIFTPEDRLAGVPAEELSTALTAGRAEDERWHIRKNGERFWALGIVTPTQDATGAHTGYSKILRDMTERQRSQEALRTSEERLRLALRAARMGIWTLDVKAEVQMRDANLNELLGLDATDTTEAFGEFFTHIHPEDRIAVGASFADSIRNRRPLHIEFRIVRPDGSIRWLRDQGDVFGNIDGGAKYMTRACVDVTERRQAEEALRASEERLRLILESATDFAILTLAPDRTVTSWSPGAAETFGYTADEILGELGDVLFVPEDQAAMAPQREAETTLRTGRAADERWHARKDGSRFYASGVMRPLHDGHGFVKVARDLTERKRMEDELRNARDRLEERVVERTADLERTTVALQTEIERRRELARRLTSAQEDERRRLSRDLHDTVGQLMAGLSLAFKAIEMSGDVPHARLADAQRITNELGRELHALTVRLRPTSLDDIGLVNALEQLVSEWSSQTGVRADFHAKGFTPGKLSAEFGTAIYRVVQEALTNIAKHAKATVVSAIITQSDSDVSVIVEDDGEGFEPSSVPKGRLGLLGMRERIEQIGGTIDIESSIGSGTTIVIHVPMSTDGAV